MENILTLNGVSKIYGDLKALDNINLTVEKGEWLAIMGPSKMTSPRDGLSIQPMIFISVVLPEPDGPIIDSHSPSSTVKFILSKAFKSP